MMHPVPITAGGAGGDPGGAVASPPGVDAHVALQPQLHIDEDADASVECHSSNPWTRGDDTGHFALTQLVSLPAVFFGKKFPRCHCISTGSSDGTSNSNSNCGDKMSTASHPIHTQQCSAAV